jgi:hypothetical protein
LSPAPPASRYVPKSPSNSLVLKSSINDQTARRSLHPSWHLVISKLRYSDLSVLDRA